MRIVVSLLYLLICCIIPLKGQQIVRSVQLQDGHYEPLSYRIQANDTCIFSATDTSVALKWWIAIDRQKDLSPRYFMPIEAIDDASCRLPINASLFTSRYHPSPIVHRFPGDEKYYYTGKIFISDDDGRHMLDSIMVYFDVLPLRPEISDITLSYQSFNYNEDYFEDGQLNVKINRRRADYYYGYIITNPYLVFEFPTSYYLVVFGTETQQGQQIHELTLPADSWGQYMFFTAINEYGIYDGDTICTTNYIDDPAIREHIENRRKEWSGVDNISVDEQYRIKVENNFLLLECDAESVASLQMLDTSGRVVMNVYQQNRIDISSLHSGLYIARLITKSNKCYNYKFIKK